MAFVDGPHHTAQRTALVAHARSSGRYGKHNTCNPGDADAWFKSLRTRFTASRRWSRYQVAKCGNYECSVHFDRQKGKAKVSDGIKPTAGNPSRKGCLILEAKSSASKTDKQSLYGTTRGKPTKPGAKPRPKKPGKGKGGGQQENVPFLAIFAITSYSSPNTLEDWIWNEWAKNRGKFHRSKWGLIRSSQIDALIRYEMACSNTDVPLCNYVVICERPYMLRYFRSIITPNGEVRLSAFRGGPNWK